MRIEILALTSFVVCTVIVFVVFLYPEKLKTAEEIQQSPKVLLRNPYSEKIMKFKYEVNKSLFFKEYEIWLPNFYDSDYFTIHNLVYDIVDTRTVKRFERYLNKYWWGLGFQSGKISIKHIEIEIYPIVVEENSCKNSFGDALILALKGKSSCFYKTRQLNDTILQELAYKYKVIYKERK